MKESRKEFLETAKSNEEPNAKIAEIANQESDEDLEAVSGGKCSIKAWAKSIADR